jgi:tRNA A-37 threonylcarbamoyl transferase component Bud32
MAETARLSTALADRYVIERELGAGGMATVYLARDKKHDREVALKVLRPELAAVLGAERFLNEIKISARLDHPHILTLIDSGAADGFLYYVLPYVRGESLRARLTREQQLSIEEALAITHQVASALDYAHRQGVVHRDIKPENILIQEGEAMLTDFGIALAVKEAGGNRLTETGLSLGTPQYMSPEQATGDRQLDARSDVYSLGAVLYEMLAGEPPVTGPTVQALIAKLLTERPTPLRIVRDTVPEGVDNAVAKALAKAPADRFSQAGDFARALEERSRPAAAALRTSRTLTYTLGIAAVAAIAALGVWIGRSQRGSARSPALMLRDRTQLTFTGRSRAPAISGDGKQLAYVTSSCGGSSCTYAVVIQDVAGTATRRVLDGATAAYSLKWSPDRRNLLFEGSIAHRYGTYLFPTLGGAPRYLTSSGADFWAGGDSLLVAPPFGPDSVFWLRVEALDGSLRDSIRIAGPGLAMYPVAIPGSPWIAAIVPQTQTLSEYRVIGRNGLTRDRLLLPSGWTRGSTDALWIQLDQLVGPNDSPPIARIQLDAKEGRFSGRIDTLYTGTHIGFDVTADGSALVLGEGTFESSAFALGFVDAVRGAFASDRRVLNASEGFYASISPDGGRLLVWRQLGSTSSGESRLSVMTFSGGPETPLPLSGRLIGWLWSDSVTVELAEQVQGRASLSLIDVRTAARRARLVIQDSMLYNLWGLAALPAGGWAWVPEDGQRFRIQRPGETAPRTIVAPPWYRSVDKIRVTPDGRGLAYIGWNAATHDSARVSVMSLAEGATTPWATAFGDNAWFDLLPDHSILFYVLETQENLTLYRLRAPGSMERLGTVPRPIAYFTVSSDLRRAAVTVRDYHGDAWISRVVRP